MKSRNIFLGVALTMCFLMLGGTASAQFTQVWKYSAGTWPMMASGDNSRGAALNNATGHYLATRRDLPRVYVFDAATGALLDSLNMTGVSGGTIALQDIEATSDGVIYGSNLITSSGSDTTFKIYRWANDNNATVPAVAFSGRPLDKNGRFGDAFDVAGTGTGTVIYVGGNASATDSLQVFTTADGSTFTNSGFIKISGQDAGAGIAQVTPGGNFYTSRFSAGQPIRLYSTGGTRLDNTPTSPLLLAAQGDLAYLEAGGRKWIATAPESISGNGRATLLNISYGLGGAVKVGSTPFLGTSANANASGDVELKYNAADSTMTIYFMVDNNGMAAYKTGNLLAINLAPFAGNIVRTIFVPLVGQPDTVYADVQDDQYVPPGNVVLKYNVNGGTDSVVVMTRTSGDSIKGTYRGIIPGAVNGDGRRIQYYVTVTDNLNSTFTSGKTGYFAGLTKMTLAGPRAVDTTGTILWNGYGVRVVGVCTQEDSLIAAPATGSSPRHDVVVQDDAGAMDIVEFAVGSVPPPWRMSRGRVYRVVGLLGQFRGHVQVGIPATGGHIFVEDLGQGTLPPPKVVTCRDLAWDRVGELLENSLVRIQHVRMTPSSLAWPAVGATGTNITITDNGIDSLTLRVPALSTANGNPPRQPFTVTGIASQYSSTSSAPFKDGYQVIMRHADDVAAEIPVGLKDTTKIFLGTDVVLPAMVGNVNGLGITAFQFSVKFDSTLFRLKTVGNIGSISSGFTFSMNVVNAGLVNIAAFGAQPLKDSGAIFTVVLIPQRGGAGTVMLTGQFNEGSPAAMTTGGFVMVMVPRQVVNIVTPKFKTAVTNVGHVGALNNYQDTTGFILGGADRLYEGSFAFATDRNHVSNAFRKVLPDAWNPGLRPLDIIQPPALVGSQIHTVTAYDDSNQANPLGIKVIQRTVADTSITRGYLMFRFWVVNRTASQLTGLRVGSYFDFDITPATANDRGEIVKDSSNQIPGVNSNNPFKIHVIYERQDPAANFIGVVPLSQTVFGGARVAIQPTEVYSSATFHLTDSVKYLYLSGFRATNTYGDGGTATDLGMFSSVGPYNVPANDTARAAFALVVGANLPDLMANARQAQRDYVAMGGVIQILTDVKEIPDAGIPTTFALEQNYPNPFNPSTTINFALPKNENVTLKVYDVLGREVRTLVNERVNAGYQQVVWDGRNAFGAQVASGMYIYRITAGDFTSSKKMMMLK